MNELNDHHGVIIEYVMVNNRDLTESRTIRFINNQVACDWLTDQWPIIHTRQRAWIKSIQTHAPIYYPDSSIHFKDSSYV